MKDPRIRGCIKEGQIEFKVTSEEDLGKVKVKQGYLDRILKQTRIFLSEIESQYRKGDANTDGRKHEI